MGKVLKFIIVFTMAVALFSVGLQLFSMPNWALNIGGLACIIGAPCLVYSIYEKSIKKLFENEEFY